MSSSYFLLAFLFFYTVHAISIICGPHTTLSQDGLSCVNCNSTSYTTTNNTIFGNCINCPVNTYRTGSQPDVSACTTYPTRVCGYATKLTTDYNNAAVCIACDYYETSNFTNSASCESCFDYTRDSSFSMRISATGNGSVDCGRFFVSQNNVIEGGFGSNGTKYYWELGRCSDGLIATNNFSCSSCPTTGYENSQYNFSVYGATTVAYNVLSPLGTCHPCNPGFASICNLALEATIGNGPLDQTCANNWAVKCQPCRYPYVSTRAASSSCNLCPAGYVHESAATCRPCADGTIRATNASSDQCTACSAGTYSDSSHTTCLSCAPGFYQPFAGQTNCTQCPPGTYANLGSAATACTPCSSTSIANTSGLTSCFQCGIGYVPNSNFTQCVVCPVATYGSSAGICSYCPKGYYNNATVASSACLPCPIGTVGGPFNYTRYRCYNCPVGTYSPSTLASTSFMNCLPCAPHQITPVGGTYSFNEIDYLSGTNLTGPYAKITYQFNALGYMCQTCADGTYPSNQTSCIACPSGFVRNSNVNSNPYCTSCGIGYYAANATTCLPCALGSITSGNGTTCIPCAAGTYYQSSTGVCIRCLFNSYSATSGLTSCSFCAPGQIVNTNQTGCLPCPGGNVRPDNQSVNLCSPCPIGTYSTDGINCNTCAAGSYSSQVGASVCTTCSEGKYASLQGASICTDCAIGFFTNVQGSITCDQCDATFSTACIGSTKCSIITSPGLTQTTLTTIESFSVNGYIAVIFTCTGILISYFITLIYY